MPQDDPFGGWVSWPAYDPAALTEVRITRGGGSVAYGPGALAGAIEMASSLASGIAGSAEIGSRASLDGTLQAGATLGAQHLSLSLAGSGGDGFTPVVHEQRGPADRPAPFQQGNARLRWVAPVGSQTELQVSLAAFHDERERGLAFTRNRTDGKDASLRLVGRGSWGWSALVYGQWRDFESSFASVDDARTKATRVSLQDDVPSSAFGWIAEVRPPLGKSAQLRLGLDGRRMDGHSHELSNYVDTQATRERQAGGEASHAGLFAEYSGTADAISFSIAARIDHWRIGKGRLDEQSLLNGAILTADNYPARTGWRPTGRVAAGVEAASGLRLRLAAYLGWRLPTLNELFRPFRLGRDATAANPDLDPERLAGAEVGLDYLPADKITLSVTAFANRMRDAIANVTLGSGPGVFPGVGFVAGEYRQRRNLDAINVHGIEASATVADGPWSFRASYSFTDARVKASGIAQPLDGLRPAQIPLHSASALVSWERGPAEATVELRYAGRQFEDDLNQMRIPPATTIDGFLAWQLSDQFRLVVRGENLFDKQVVAGIAGNGVVERATPRTLWIGLRFDGQGASGTP